MVLTSQEHGREHFASQSLPQSVRLYEVCYGALPATPPLSPASYRAQHFKSTPSSHIAGDARDDRTPGLCTCEARQYAEQT